MIQYTICYRHVKHAVAYEGEIMTEIKIAILNVEKIDNGKSTIGKIDWKLNNTEFYGWKVIKSEKGTFIAAPSEKVGETYRPLIKFPQELMKTVSEQLLQSWRDNHQ